MASSQQVFYDEEECLGFGVFVAELELILGTSRGRSRPDQTALLELLQKLQASIISTRDSAVLKQHQRRCEAALYDIIYKGSCAAVSCWASLKDWHAAAATVAALDQQGIELKFQLCPAYQRPGTQKSATGLGMV